MIIQCREELATEIIDLMLPMMPEIQEMSGGHIQCFDKGWVFLEINKVNKKVIDMLNATTTPYILATHATNIWPPSIKNQGVNTAQSYLYIRTNPYPEPEDIYTAKTHLTVGYSSYINFVEPSENK